MNSLFCICQVLHHCIHNQIMNESVLETRKIYSDRKTNAEVEWKPIRIQIDYGFLDGTKHDPDLCRSPGQQVKNQQITQTCVQQDILNQQQIKAIKGTIENVKAKFQRMLKVIPTENSFPLENFNNGVNTPIPPGSTASGTDLYITVISRPYGDSTTLASAVGHRLDGKYYRPFQGFVFINPKHVPSEVQNEDSTDCKWFMVVLHEFTHALGFSGGNFYYFHPYENTEKYKDPICKITKLGKTFSFLVTPYAHIWAVKHYGVLEFKGDDGKVCKSGIEIEDGGQSGTVGSHLEGRTFFTEYMTGITVQTSSGPFQRLTDATLAVLQDSGNYKCDYKEAKPLIWGHPESINGDYIKGFGIEPAASVFPKGYLSDLRVDADMESFDFKYFGSYNELNINRNPDYKCYSTPSNNDAKEYCKAKSFYNPKNDNIIGLDSVFDWALIKFPTYVCPPGQAVLRTEGLAKLCGEYQCNGYKNFSWKYYPNPYDKSVFSTLECNNETIDKMQILQVKRGVFQQGYKITCPNPERFCRTMKLYEGNFKTNPFKHKTQFLDDIKGPDVPLPPDDDDDDPDKQKEGILIKYMPIIFGSVIALAAFMLVIVIVGFCIYKKKKHHKHHESA